MDKQEQHILDYVQFNEEQMAWFDEVEKKNIAHQEWLEEFLKDLPFEIKSEM